MREEIKKERNKKKVLSQYPNAFAEYGECGIRIMSGDTYIAEEFFMPETSCEHRNSFLDRGVVVGTQEDRSLGLIQTKNLVI